MDSEYDPVGKFKEDDTYTFGFANNHGEKHFFDRPNDVWKFLITKRLRRIVVWSMLPEFGSLCSWHILNAPREDLAKFAYVKEDEPRRLQPYHFRIPRGEKETVCYDIQGFFKNSRWKGMRLASLSNMAKFLSNHYEDPSIYKPESPELMVFLGKRKPETQREWDLLHERVTQDAYVTSKAAEYLERDLMGCLMTKPNLFRFRSWGGVARKVFDFPKMNIHMGGDVFCQNAHLIIKDNSPAGRSDCFSTGAIPSCFYMDVSSLYPLSVISTDALRIEDVEWMEDNELDAISKPEDVHPYAWIYGTFQTDGGEDGYWGLPHRGGERNYYLTGATTGLYNTLDLIASHAKIVGNVLWGLKPKFRQGREMHEKYASYLLKKLKRKFTSEVERTAAKDVLNASYGSLGLTHPHPSIRSNFPAYSVVLAQSRLLMSQIFDRAPKPIHYCDTDSLFIERKTIEGKLFDLTDLERKIALPVILEEKGHGEHPYIFRSKHYWLSENDYGFHAVTIDLDDWERVIQTLPSEATVRRQIRGTLLTRSKRARELGIGRWMDVHLSIALDRLSTMFYADNKRCRQTYDSYSLMRDGKWIGSRSWTTTEFYRHLQREEIVDTFQGLPSGMKRSRLFLRKWLKEYARDKQDVRCSIEYVSEQPTPEMIALLLEILSGGD